MNNEKFININAAHPDEMKFKLESHKHLMKPLKGVEAFSVEEWN